LIIRVGKQHLDLLRGSTRRVSGRNQRVLAASGNRPAQPWRGVGGKIRDGLTTGEAAGAVENDVVIAQRHLPVGYLHSGASFAWGTRC
jgi:hypothetical protein